MRPELAIPFHSLRLDSLSFLLRLGATEEERAAPQEVRVTLELRFKRAPGAVHSDALAETLCYGGIAEQLRSRLAGREFCLLERLGAEIYCLLKEECRGAELAVAVHKVKAPVEGLLGGAWYRCGDFPL